MMETGRVYIKPHFLASRSLISLDSTPIVTQSQLIGIGILAALLLALALSRRDGVHVAKPLALLGLAAGSALALGALSSLAMGGDGFSSVGALAGALGVVAAFRWACGARETAALIDVVTPSGFVALGFARLGCLFEGCDFGRPTDGWASVSYAAPHPVWFHHVAIGQVKMGASWSAAIHPFPLYIALPLALLIVAACAVPGGAGRRAVLVVFGYAVVRTVAELFRDPASTFGVGFLTPGIVGGFGLAALAFIYWSTDVSTAFGAVSAHRDEKGRDRGQPS